MPKHCETCGADVVKPGAKRFCSRACYGAFLKTQPAWNAGRKETRPEVLERIRKAAESKKGKPSWMTGRSHSAETREKISKAHLGRPAWNKGKKMSGWTEEERERRLATRGQPRKLNGRAALGFTAADHMRLWIIQSGQCGICRSDITRHEIDHCHNSSKVRGLLCGNCNRGIGLLQEDVEVLRSAIAYLESPPAESL